MPKEQCQRATIDLASKLRMCLDCAQFRSEQQRITLPTVVERLFSQSIPDQGECPVMPIPECDGEHAHGDGQGARDAPGGKTGEQSFSIRTPAPCIVTGTVTRRPPSFLSQSRAQF